MNEPLRHSHPSVRRLMCVLSAVIVAGLRVQPVPGQPDPSNARIVDYVHPSLIATNALSSARPNSPPPFATFTESARYRHPLPRRRLTTAEKWERFEAKFGIQERSADRFRSALQTAKYNLDDMVFSVQRLHDTVKDAVEFDYAVRDLYDSASEVSVPRRIYSNPFADAMENARLKSSFDIDTPTGRFFAGFKLVLPVGD